MAPRKSFLLRISEPLWREIETWAQQEFRSVNAQIEFLLHEAARRRRSLEPPLPDAESPLPPRPSPPVDLSADSESETGLEMGLHD